MLFDLSGTRHDTPMKTIKIDLTTEHGVIGEEATHLDPSDNPHEVGDFFGRTLIASGRAVEHDPEHPIKPAKKGEEKGAKKGKDDKGDK